jgi:adenylosuccinate lyase
MSSGVFDDALNRHLFATEELRAIFSDRARAQKWYDYEAALALEQAELGIIPRQAAEEIARNARVDNVELEAIAAEIRRVKHPLVPALKALQKRCAGDAGEYVHFGPTTQDVLDTATALQLREAHRIYLRDVKAIGRALARLAEAHKATPMAGRSHGVQALPITFGHKAAVWLCEMGRNYERLREVEKRVFVGSMAGAVGTQASFGPKAFELEARLMNRLGLHVAHINWQPARDRFAEYACVLGILAGTLGKIAREIVTLEHTEIGELHEPFSAGKVGSSTMPHKRNPSTCEAVVANSRALRYNAAFMLECMLAEHERDGAAWRGEWKALPEACLMAGAMLAMAKQVLEGLEVDASAMRENLGRLGGLLLSERVMFALADKLGKQSAHELVYEASMRAVQTRVGLEHALMEDEKVRAVLSADQLRALLDPSTYVGHAVTIVERVLERERSGSWLS